jgi:hypothetical protein
VLHKSTVYSTKVSAWRKEGSIHFTEITRISGAHCSEYLPEFKAMKLLFPSSNKFSTKNGYF